MPRARTNPRATLLQRLGLLVVAALVPTLSCSDDGAEPKRAKEKPETPFSSYSIKIYSGSARKRIDLPPVSESSLRVPFDRLLAKAKAPPIPKGMAAPKQLPPKEANAGELGPKVPGSKPQASVDTPDGGVALDGDLSTRAGWALVYGAAFECGMVVRPPGSGGNAVLYPNAQVPVVPPWSEPGSYFIFRSSPSACEHQLAFEETLLCIADKLSEIADTPASVTWSKVPDTSPYPELPPGPWVIPPQASKDRFIARDLAIHLVAVLGFTDLTLRASAPGASSTTWTCATAYGEAAKVTTTSPAGVVQNHLDLTFGALDNSVPLYLPPKDLTITAAHFEALAAARVIFNAHVLRAAGRLLRDQIPKGVVADMAGGEQQRARATDPLRGAKLLWGETTDAERPYNSLAHATRFSTGRWERGLLEGITALTTCSTVPPMDQLKEGMRAEFSARSRDLPVQTADQEFAAKLFDQAGIVVPEVKVTGTPGTPGTPIQTLRAAVLDQLIANTAAIHGVSPTDPDFNSWGEGNAVKLMFGKLADEDVRFGLLRGFNNYRQLASADDQTIAIAKANPGGGLVANATVASLETLGAVAIDGGIPRKDLATDVTARVGGVQMAAQCDEFGGLAGALLADYGYFAAFQDVFHIGDTLRKRLVALREEAALFSSPDEDAVKVPLGGSVEIRTWAGPGRMVLTAEAGRFGGPGLIRLFLLGFNPEDFAVTTPDAIADEVVLTYGKPWVADCAARTRASCPTNFDTAYLARATAHTVWSDVDPTTLGFDRNWARIIGSDGVIIELDFDLAAAGGQFLPQYISNGNPDDRVYVVARHDPLAPTSKGRVLGAMATRTNGGFTSAVVSGYQKLFWKDTLGVSPKFERDSLLPKGPSAATPPAYCIEGIEREPFVPLENELTSDSDGYESSWKHYLALAKSAATRADELGAQVIELGLERDLRREAAGEELADLCGDYTALDKIPLDKAKGTIGKSDTDKSLNTCLGEERFDVVFLTKEPPDLLALTTEAKRTAWIKQRVLLCDSTGASNPLCANTTLTHAGLGISEFVSEDTTASDDQCKLATSLPGSLLKAFAASNLQQLTSSPWVSSANFMAILGQLDLDVLEDGNWRLAHAGAKVMDSQPGPLWPGCLAGPGTNACAFSQSAPLANPLSVMFDKVFRPDATSPYVVHPVQLMALLWRVEGALWLMGALAGEVPAGLFTAFVPAAHLSNQGVAWSDTDQVPIPTVFADGRFSLVNAPDTYVLASPPNNGFQLTDTDTKLIGEVRPIHATGFKYAASGAPQWVKDVYGGPAARYLHVPASNAAVDLRAMESTSFAAQFVSANGYKQKPFFPETDKLGAWLSGRGSELDGMACGSLSGDPVAPKASYGVAATVIGTSKFFNWGCEDGANGVDALRLWGPILMPLSHARYRVVFASGTTSCRSSTGGTYDIATEQRGCLYQAGGPTGGRASAASYRRPQKCTPAERVVFFVNSYPSQEACTAAAELTQAVALGCIFSQAGSLPVPTTPPAINQVEDIQKLERWVGSLEKTAGSAVSRLYLQQVPARVVADFTSGSVGTGSLKGEHGQLILEMESSVRSVADGWYQVGGRLSKIRAALEGARLQIDLNKIQSQIESKQLAISRWQVHSKIAHAIANSISGFGIESAFNPLGGAAQTGAAAWDLKTAQLELSALNEIQALQTQAKGNQLFQILTSLEDTTSTLYGETYSSLAALQKSTASAAQVSEQLRFGEVSAQYQAAKGGGADFARIGGETVEFPVNIVLNRQYDVTRRRYEAALKEARYLAYVARLAIEQRLGMRLESFKKNLGPLDAPSEWADDVCSLTGVDYEKLRDITVPDGGFAESDSGNASSGPLDEFVDMYIGDYVDKLEKFVEFYNMEYPSHDGDDLAVVSLRDDLLGAGGLCTKSSPNLLLYSSELTGAHMVSEATTVTRGWVKRACTSLDAHCLYLGEPASLTPPPSPPEAGPGSGYTWLYDVPIAQVTDPVDLAEIASQQSPARMVYQEVKLEAGTYALSWWDQGRTLAGAPGTAPDYPVTIYDEQWNVIATKVYTPNSATAADASVAEQWGTRRELPPFSLPSPSIVRVAFAAAVAGAGAGSVLIANVQLEKAAVAGPYWANGSSPLMLDTKCASGSVASLQQAFQYLCKKPGDCFYELKAPFSIDTEAIDLGDSKLIGKIAASNFNYRHITLALNLVGTGVVDCTLEPTASCFGSAFVEYTLDHSAFDVEVLSHERPDDAQHFNFGLGSINRGKALAAERFITLPTSSADQALLSQPAFEKKEYGGRPLDGSYRLRIHDKPSLRWNKIEDVQLVLQYRYWSRIQPQPSSK